MANIQPGDRLSTKASANQTHEVVRELTRLQIGATAIVYATYVDKTGVSVYIKRGGGRSDIEGFIPNGHMDTWMSYFDVGTGFGDGANRAYAGTKHKKWRFPVDCR